MRPSSAVSTLLFFLSTAAGIAGALAVSQTHRGPPFSSPEDFAALFVGFVLGIFLAMSVKVVAQWERMLVLRLGKLTGVAEPGMRLLVPIFDTPIFIEMRTQTVDIARQQAITQDNIPVVVNGVIFFRVKDPRSAALEVQDYRAAIGRLAQATIRDVAGRLSLDELLSHQDRLEQEIARSVDVQSKAWGLHVEAIKLEDIDVPEELKKMMSRQASSEREKRATIIKADGDRQAAAALAQAAATMAESPGAMQLRVLQTLDGLGPSASNTVVLALPIEIVEMVRAYTNGRHVAAVSPEAKAIAPRGA
jgi:regulator of protease activity HflC (stomatin/prohibitin superfamily)